MGNHVHQRKDGCYEFGSVPARAGETYVGERDFIEVVFPSHWTAPQCETAVRAALGIDPLVNGTQTPSSQQDVEVSVSPGPPAQVIVKAFIWRGFRATASQQPNWTVLP